MLFNVKKGGTNFALLEPLLQASPPDPGHASSTKVVEVVDPLAPACRTLLRLATVWRWPACQGSQREAGQGSWGQAPRKKRQRLAVDNDPS
eukprot:1151913-Pelagomonas_calceolata.AAC.12